jgi:hypothetical protein
MQIPTSILQAVGDIIRAGDDVSWCARETYLNAGCHQELRLHQGSVLEGRFATLPQVSSLCMCQPYTSAQSKGVTPPQDESLNIINIYICSSSTSSFSPCLSPLSSCLLGKYPRRFHLPTYLPTVWKEKSLRVLFNASGMSLSNGELTPAQEQKSRTYRWSRNAEHSMSLVPRSHSDSQLDNTLPSIQTSCSAWQTYSRASLIHQLAAWETVNPNVEEKKRILGLAFWNRRCLRGGENSRLLTLSEGSNSIEQHKTSLICEAVPVIGVANGGRMRRCSSAHVRPYLSWP